MFEINKTQFTRIIFILLILIVLFKEYYTDTFNDTTYDVPKEKIDNVIKKIITAKEKKISDKLILACKDGLLKGSIVGCVNGGVPGAIAGGMSYGIANPIIVYLTEFNEK
jgi:hypothetical protein